MQTFLEEVTDHIISTYGKNTGEVCIVTPNRRAGLFLRKYFAARVVSPMWAPDMLSIEDFVNRLSGFTICDKTDLVFELFETYKGIEKDKAENLEAFLNWAPAILRDFDDIDSSLIERKAIYGDIRDFKQMDLWVPGEQDLTAFQKQYLAFIDRMHTYHELLAQRMMSKKMAWQGLSTSMVAKQLQDGDLSLPWEVVVFTGFNALTGAEQAIVKELLSSGKAEYIIDEDPYYADDPEHEAGRFIRKYKQLFGLKSGQAIQSHFKKQEKRVTIFGIAKNVNQARLAGNLFLSGNGISQDEHTAVVLANETLLIPTLNALPEQIQDINVTMGYPLTNTHMFGFFDAIFQLQIQSIDQPERKGETVFHFRDLQRFFSHGNTALLWSADQGESLTASFLNKLRQGNQTYLSYDEMVELADADGAFTHQFKRLFVSFSGQPDKLFLLFLELASELDVQFRGKAATRGSDVVRTPFFVDFESLYYFSKIFRRTTSFLSKFPFLTSLKTLYRLFRQSASESRLSFSGEPLQGLQLMGMLETRGLDFRNVVILAANEHILPRSSHGTSFIPYEVKKAHGLRTYNEQDAIYAYHFYRLLQRARNITIIYNTQTEDMGSNEKSRYVTQLLHELPAFNPEIAIAENVVSIQPVSGQIRTSLSVKKSKDILQRLDGLSQKGFSPSALSNYMLCPFQFYLKRVAGLDEADAVEETMEAMTVGNIAHGVLEELYKPYVGQVLQPAHVERMKSSLGDHLHRQLEKMYPGGHIRSGKNLLIKHLINRYLENYLHAEFAFLQHLKTNNQNLTIEALESKLSTCFRLGDDLQDNSGIVISGKADRIDRIGSMVRIIDYKTGVVAGHDLKFTDWDQPFTSSQKIKSFQLLTYAWLYYRMHPDTAMVQPGIITLRSPAMGLIGLKLPGEVRDIRSNDLAEFESRLEKLLMEIMNPTVAFNQTNKEENCKFCPFTTLCSRHGAG